MIASWTAAALETLLLPAGLLVLIAVWWSWARRREL